MADQQEQWNPVEEARKTYPALKDWSDDRILENLSDPAKFKSAFPQYSHLDDDVIKRNITSLQTPDFTSNPNKEGLYPLYGKVPTKENPEAVGVLQVPYSKVPRALQKGYTFHEGSGDIYQKDFEAASKSPSLLGEIGAKIQSALEPVSHEGNGAKVVSNVDRAAGRAIASVPGFLKDLAAAFREVPNDQGMALMKLTDPAQIPVTLQRQFQEDSKVDKKMAVDNLIGNIVGMGLSGKLLGAGGKILKGVAKIPTIPTNFSEHVRSFVGDEPAQDLVHKTLAENEKQVSAAEKTNTTNASKHLEDALDATLAANKHANIEGFRSDTLDRENAAKEAEHNTKELARIKREGEARLDALKANKDNITDYEARRDAIKKQNDANYRREIRQQNLQTKLKAASAKLDTLYQKAFKGATTTYNATWKKWRDLVKNATADMTPTVDVIRAQEASMNPQQVTIFRDILRETSPDAADMSDDERTRQSVMKNLGYGGTEYKDLSGPAKTSIDDMMKSINLANIQATGLKEVPASRLHGWKSQLERAVRTTSDGTVRYAIGQVLDQVRKSEGDVSASVGPDAVKQLAKGRSITGPYFDAFFKSPEDHPRAAGQSLREQTPEYVREKGAEQRLARIAAYNPDLAPAAKLVANLKEGLESLEKERNIGKISELPARPEVAPVPTVTPAGNFEPTPFEPRPGSDKLVTPERPVTVEPETVKAGIDDLVKAREEAVRNGAKWFRYRGRWIATSAVVGTGMIFNFLHANLIPASYDIVAGATAFYVTGKVADFLERPDVKGWLAQPTARDIQVLKQLPPEQLKELSGVWKPVIETAEAKGIDVSRSLLKLFGITAAAQPRKKKPTPKELLDQAHQDLQSQFHQTGLAPAPGPSSSNGGTNGTVKMKAPNGHTKDVPKDQVDHYKQLGAMVVQ